jgi:hypothetical protein
MEILRGDSVSAIARKSPRLSGRGEQMVLGLIRPFGDMQVADDSYESMP